MRHPIRHYVKGEEHYVSIQISCWIAAETKQGGGRTLWRMPSDNPDRVHDHGQIIHRLRLTSGRKTSIGIT